MEENQNDAIASLEPGKATTSKTDAREASKIGKLKPLLFQKVNKFTSFHNISVSSYQIKTILSMNISLSNMFFSVTNEATPSTTQSTDPNNAHEQEISVESQNLIENLFTEDLDGEENGTLNPLLFQTVNKFMPFHIILVPLIKSKPILSVMFNIHIF